MHSVLYASMYVLVHMLYARNSSVGCIHMLQVLSKETYFCFKQFQIITCVVMQVVFGVIWFELHFIVK